MNILGVSFDYHEAAAALVQDGKVISAALEERFTRKKNDPSLPENAIKFCCDYAGIGFDDLDYVVFYEKTLLRFDRILRASLFSAEDRKNYLWPTIDNWISKGKFFPENRLADFLGISKSKIKSVKHHEAHAASAFYCSPFEQATVVTIDGVGEYESATISKASCNEIKCLTSNYIPHSLGLFYSTLTAFLGFKVNEDEYKVMGMAGYGEPVFYKLLRDMFELRDDGTFEIDQQYFDFLHPIDLPYTSKLIDLLGPPREPESAFLFGDDIGNDLNISRSSKHYANIAASVQKVTEEVILHIVQRAIEQTKVNDVCLAGGVALNSLANGRIRKLNLGRLYVQPAAGDSGGAIGAALYWNFSKLGGVNRTPMESAYLGRSYSKEEVQSAINESFTLKYEYMDDEDELCDRVAKLIEGGSVVGWFHGRSEFGPRSLGARSILANPLIPSMQAIVNKSIKFREAFRPFAPAVTEEDSSRIFEIADIKSRLDPEYFMMSVNKVREEFKSRLPSITHVDGTARLQIVNPTANPRFYKLIKKFELVAGLPVILNTSFNLRGEPIIETPLNAIRTFEWSGMNYLVLENFLITKE
jgi:carbamoyltransferase